jgi:hypothetical protein
MTTPTETPRILVVANRTASTALLLDEITRQSRKGAHITVLIPPDHHDDWTPEVARRICGRAAGRDVATLDCGADALDTIHTAVGDHAFDAIVVSTAPEHLSRWVHHDLPHRIQHLGLPVTVIPPEPGAVVPDDVKSGLGDDWYYMAAPLAGRLG